VSVLKFHSITYRTEKMRRNQGMLIIMEVVTRLVLEFSTRVTLVQYNLYSLLNRSVSSV
jgi:hypothetical protein